ncbi:MAG: response regulator [Bacteroidetes bacterium]|nr:response regulator [Bacteroidota bacterium]
MSDLRNYKILLIDDLHENLLALSATLKQAGYDSDSALSGVEGLSLLRRNKYGLIILDVQMPEMNGFEVAELIKGNSKTKTIPILFLSANVIEKDFFRKGHEVGALDYLTKPVDEALLLLKVKNFLELHHASVILEQANRKLEKKALDAEISYQDLYCSLPQDVILLNTDGVVVNINRSGMLSSGIHSKELLGRHFTKSAFLTEIIKNLQIDLDLQNMFDKPDMKQKVEFKIEKTSRTFFYGEALVCVVLIDGKFHSQISLSDITQAKLAELQLSHEIRATKKYQSMLLSSQINPHFMFNALNSVQYFVLMKEDVEMALHFIADFSHLMRSTLTNSRSEFIRISDELSFLQLYLALECKRLENKFTYTIELGDGVATEELYIPPMLIQPYLENAVIHGLANNLKDSRILIRVLKQQDQIECSIQDNGIGREKAKELSNLRSGNKKHLSMGMNITETRIKLLNELYGDSFVVTVKDLKDKFGLPRGTLVKITLPVLTDEMIFDIED